MYSLSEIRNELLAIVNSINEGDWNKKTEAAEWTAGQVVHHLAQSDEFFLTILKKEVHNDSKPVARRDIQFIADRSIKFDSPISPPPDNVSKEEALAYLHRIREELLSFIDQHPMSVLEMKSVNLGRLGVINLSQIVEFIALHERRHMEQINDIIEALSVR